MADLDTHVYSMEIIPHTTMEVTIYRQSTPFTDAQVEEMKRKMLGDERYFSVFDITEIAPDVDGLYSLRFIAERMP